MKKKGLAVVLAAIICITGVTYAGFKKPAENTINGPIDIHIELCEGPIDIHDVC